MGVYVGNRLQWLTPTMQWLMERLRKIRGYCDKALQWHASGVDTPGKRISRAFFFAPNIMKDSTRGGDTQMARLLWK